VWRNWPFNSKSNVADVVSAEEIAQLPESAVVLTQETSAPVAQRLDSD
jgi:hypothetical protein